jgi:hypothetical protein
MLINISHRKLAYQEAIRVCKSLLLYCVTGNKSPAHRAAVVPHMSHQYLTMVVYALMDSDEKGVPPQKEGQRNRSNNKQGKSSKGQQIISTSDNDIEFYIRATVSSMPHPV